MRQLVSRPCVFAPSSPLVDLAAALSKLATLHLESWSLAMPHTIDEGEMIADCIDVLCLPALVGGDEMVTMEKGVEPWCMLLRFMKKMAASGTSEAERVVYDVKVAKALSSLVLSSQRSQLKEMFTHTFDIVSLSIFTAHTDLTCPLAVWGYKPTWVLV